MNIYPSLNKAIDYIENNLENEIEYKTIYKILGMNDYMAQNAFYILCDISISDYIRKRRLSMAGHDLYSQNESVMDVAIKYNYTSATAFSRAFEKFHGIKPSKVKQNPQGLKVYSRIHFNEDIEEKKSIEYSIVSKDELILYGVSKKTTIKNIGKDAPKFWQEQEKNYRKKYGEFTYGMISYEDRWNNEKCEYWVLYDKKIEHKEFQKVIIPAGKWIVFKINSQEAKEIQKASQIFYKEFIQSTNYKMKEIPELEYYHNDITEFLIPIED